MKISIVCVFNYNTLRYVILGAIGPAGVGKPLPWMLKPLREFSPVKWACEGLCVSELKALERGNEQDYDSFKNNILII
jgi:hypothetical protein